MTRHLFIVAVACVAAGCLDFNKLITDCEDGGPCAADGGSGDGGADAGPDAGTFPPFATSLCHRTDNLCFEFPFRTSVDLNDVWGSAPNDVWVAGEGGVLLHWNGSALESWWGAVPPDHYAQFWGRAANDVFLVGPATHSPQHFDGTQWSDDGTVMPGYELYAVDGTDSANLTAVGNAGTVMHRDANRWSVSHIDGTLVGVRQTATDCFASTNQFDGGGYDYSSILSCSGATSRDIRDGGLLFNMFGVGAKVAVTSSQGSYWAYESSTWLPVTPSPVPSTDLRRCLTTSTDVAPLFCVGTAGSVWPDLHAQTLPEQPFLQLRNFTLWGAWADGDGGAWASGDYGQLAQRALDGGWTIHSGSDVGDLTLYAVASDGTRVIAAGSTGGILRRGATQWVGPNLPAFGGEDVRVLTVTPDGTWLGAGINGHVWRSVDHGATWRSEDAGLPNEQLQGLWAASANDYYVATDQGRVLHRTPAGWTVAVADAGIEPTDGGRTGLWKITGDGSGKVWAVGENTTVVSFDGTTWSTQQLDPGSTDVLYGVWAVGPDDVWAVGGSTFTWHLSGGVWAPVQKAPLCPWCAYFDVWGTGPSDVYAVGQDGLVVHYDGTAWQDVFLGTRALRTGKFEAIRGVGGALFIVGDRGTILRAQP